MCDANTPLPVPSPKPVSTNFDVYAYYLYFRGLTNGADESTGYGYATVVPLYGEQQDPRTMSIDIKWAREHGITTFVMPVAFPDSPWEKRIDTLFLPASDPPFEINYSLMFNAGPYLPGETPAYPLSTGVVKEAREFLSGHLQHPRYKRLPDGRPVIFYFEAGLVAYFMGLDELEKSVDLLRSNLGEDIFLVGDVMAEPFAVKTDPKYQSADYIRRQVKLFDAITSYYMWRAGYEWHSLQDFNHVVTPFQDMIIGYQQACDLWGTIAHKYGAKLVPPISPAGVSDRLLYEAGQYTFLVDRHEGVSYDTAKEMAEIGARYAEPDLKMTIVGAWNECNEGAAIVPSKGFKFGPAHAVRDTFAIEPTGGWPEDYYPPS